MFHLKRTPWDSDTRRAAKAPMSSKGRQRLEVRREAVSGSGEKAARRDLESDQPLGARSHFQIGLHASHRAAVHNRIDHAVADIAVVDEELADLEREQEWRASDVKHAEKATEDAKAKLEKIPIPRRLAAISTFAYVTVMALFAGCEYPLLRLSFVRLPVDDQTVKVVAILTGATLVAGVHVLALAAARLVQAEGDRIEGRRDWLAHRAVLAFGVTFYSLVVAGLAWVRAGEITEIGRAFGGSGMSHPIWLGVALGFLHGATLLAAFHVSYLRARGAEWRDAQLTVEQRESEKKDADQALEETDRREARLYVRREEIAERSDRDLEQLHQHHKLEESKYLAILARAHERQPKPVDDWDYTRTPRERCVPPTRSLEQPSPNGKFEIDTTARLRRALPKA